MKPTSIRQPLPFDEATTPSPVSTGHLPSGDEVRSVLVEAYERYKDDDDGEVADYIPALAEARPELFGASIVSVRGEIVDVGDADHEFSIQSVSKPFVFALVCQEIGFDAARDKLGVNSTGLPFDSVMAVELNELRTMNPMVNAGAIAATSLMPGATAGEKWDAVRAGLSRFAGRELTLDVEVYESEAATNFRNRGIAHLLDGYHRLYFDPAAATDVYTRQCSLSVSARDLAVMGATLADGGVNPVTGERVIAARHCKRVLAVLATAGLYELSGDWLYEVGLPGKSGVSGGIVTVAPGKGGLGTFSPRLDEAGNSVRGQRLTKHLSERLGLNLFASQPVRPVPDQNDQMTGTSSTATTP
jgi:glutaminase